MGDDLSVVNAARVSFDKESIYLDDRDKKLLKYLARNNHWTPFGHTALSYRIKAPLFVARQLGKHQVGLVWNEVSRRYVISEPEFYMPISLRRMAANVKQGSDDVPVATSDKLLAEVRETTEQALAMYKTLLARGVCPEQARMVLPQHTMTEWIWTGSLAAFARVCNLRLDPHTQQETRAVAAGIYKHAEEKFPHSWDALMEN